MGEETARDIIADFLDQFSDQPYRMADVLFGRLDKAGLDITPTDNEFMRAVEDNALLRADLATAKTEIAELRAILETAMRLWYATYPTGDARPELIAAREEFEKVAARLAD
jgi:hypothetical protein